MTLDPSVRAKHFFFQILDVNNLTIESIQLDDGTALEFIIDGQVPNFGSKLTIILPQQVTAGEK